MLLFFVVFYPCDFVQYLVKLLISVKISNLPIFSAVFICFVLYLKNVCIVLYCLVGCCGVGWGGVGWDGLRMVLRTE